MQQNFKHLGHDNDTYQASEVDRTSSGACRFEKASHAHGMWPSAITLPRK